MKNKIIVGNGYIGSYLSKILDIPTFSSKDIQYDRKQNIDLFMFELFDRLGPGGIIINCTGYTGKPNVDACEKYKDDCYFYNVTFLEKLCIWCNKNSSSLINITSGCIFDDKDSNYTSKVVNFGYQNKNSSFYSKTKHYGETIMGELYHNHELDEYINIRVRMPLCDDLNNSKNILNKFINYNTLIDEVNSKTYLPNLARGINLLLQEQSSYLFEYGLTLNATNPNPISTKKIIEILGYYNLVDKSKKEWTTHDRLKEIGFIQANRSTCVLEPGDELAYDTVKQFYSYFEPEENVIHKVCDYNVDNE